MPRRITIKRTIYFYKIKFLDNHGNPVDPLPLFTFIDRLPFAYPGRYYKRVDQSLLSMHVDNLTDPISFQLGLTRMDALPMIDDRGTLNPLLLPTNTSGLYEPFHATLFSNNILGAEYNYFGPRIGNLVLYLKDKLNHSVRDVVLINLVRPDLYTLLNNLSEIKVFTLEIPRQNVGITGELHSNLQSGFENMAACSDADNIQVRICNTSNRDPDIQLPFKDRLAEFVMHRRNEIKNLRLKAREFESEVFKDYNLLDYFMYSKKEVIKEEAAGRHVQSQDMYRAIQDAYNEFIDEINRILDVT